MSMLGCPYCLQVCLILYPHEREVPEETGERQDASILVWHNETLTSLKVCQWKGLSPPTSPPHTHTVCQLTSVKLFMARGYYWGCRMWGWGRGDSWWREQEGKSIESTKDGQLSVYSQRKISNKALRVELKGRGDFALIDKLMDLKEVERQEKMQ